MIISVPLTSAASPAAANYLPMTHDTVLVREEPLTVDRGLHQDD